MPEAGEMSNIIKSRRTKRRNARSRRVCGGGQGYDVLFSQEPDRRRYGLDSFKPMVTSPASKAKHRHRKAVSSEPFPTAHAMAHWSMEYPPQADSSEDYARRMVKAEDVACVTDKHVNEDSISCYVMVKDPKENTAQDHAP